MFSQLKKLGLLGMNARIGQYMNPLNPRKYYPLVDNKIKTATLAAQFGIPMPQTYHVFESYGDVSHLGKLVEDYENFAIKPARGAMGKGVLVIHEKREGEYLKASGKSLSLEDLRYHILQIMGGLYSLSSYPDHALLQYKIKIHPTFRPYLTEGIPDIRVIVYGGIPVMAMTRLPTHASEGRANLHQGAVGAGLNMSTGQVTYATYHDHLITHHPDSGHLLNDLVITPWLELLRIAARCYEMTGMGYLGVDLVLDAEFGPMVLELNARPGLSIQVANQKGLRGVLENFRPYLGQKLKPEDRVQIAMENQSKI